MYLGIHAFSHDASAAIINDDGRIIAAVQEERYSHVKRDPRFPVESIAYCLREADVSANELSGIGFGWDPALILFQRILRTNLTRLPISFSAIMESCKEIVHIWNVPRLMRKHFDLDLRKVPVRYFRHHACHAASAYYASPFDHAAFLTIDGGGELEALTWGTAAGGTITKRGQSYLPDSIGRVYSATSRFLGFWGAEKDGTVMALAAFGAPRYADVYQDMLKPSENERTVGVTTDPNYFSSNVTNTAMFSRKFEKTFGIPPRTFEEPITQVHRDIATSVQKRTEEVIIELLRRLHAATGETVLVLAGGVALNSVLNGKLEKISPFKNVFIQPAASDAGLSLGAAYLSRQTRYHDKPRYPMKTAALGPSFTDEECAAALDRAGLRSERPADVARTAAEMIAAGQVVAWFQGRMEFGPRALGQRSLLADARSPDMIDRLNLVKKREKFRPFAISILEERALEVLENIDDSPFMLMVDTVRPEWKRRIPSAQHVDGSVRVQTVNRERDGRYYDLVKEFESLTGVPLVINTSLNVKGQPIVCTPSEAIDTFLRSPIDALVIGPYVARKPEKNG